MTYVPVTACGTYLLCFCLLTNEVITAIHGNWLTILNTIDTAITTSSTIGNFTCNPPCCFATG